jgi:hypothetical protein
VPRRGHTHTVYLDKLAVDLINAWLTERRQRWPDTTNPHMFITSQSAPHPARPPLSYSGLRAAFDQVGTAPGRQSGGWVEKTGYHPCPAMNSATVGGLAGAAGCAARVRV